MEADGFFRHELNLKPKQEDAGTFKAYVSILMAGSFDQPMPSFLSSWQEDQSLSDYASGSRKLTDLLNEAGVTSQHADYARSQLDKVFYDLFSPVGCFTTSASCLYMYFKVIPPPIEEVIQASFNEATNNIRFRPASKLAVASLPRKVYNTENKGLSSDFILCTICLTEFKNKETLVTLPCGHDFDESCILVCFETNHVCPLCRFELPCEEMN